MNISFDRAGSAGSAFTFKTLVLLSFVSCAGPTTPFGSHVLMNPSFKARIPSSSGPASITSYPKTQLYHSPFDLVLQIKDEKSVPKDFRYEILYNGRKLSRWYRGEKILFNQQDPNIANIVFKNLSLLPGRKNEITFLYYRDKKSSPVSYRFGPPNCSFRKANGIGTLRPFRAQGLSASEIEQIAKKNKINPTLLAALVAQESGFNPLAISWAKAVGLTQVTTLANREILPLRPKWQYDKTIESLSFLELKTKILTGEINRSKDWRLDKSKSLEGGSIYLNILDEYWKREEALGALSIFKNGPPMTDILLASYNSGAYRVKRSIIRNKQDWLESRELKEARKYVMNVKSYCHAFSEKN